MTKIHITLVGGQTAPVYLGIVDSNPDKVLLIHSEQTMDEANRIYSEMQVSCELYKFHPVDLNEIEKSTLKLVASLKVDDFVSINLGGGTKPWTIMLYDYFKNRDNTTLTYIDQNNLVWDLINRSKHEAVFDMDVQFRLYGNSLTDFKHLSVYTDTDKTAINEIKALRDFNIQDFNEITANLAKFTHITIQKAKGGSEMEWLPSEKAFRCVMTNVRGKKMAKRLTSDHIRSLILNTGWFELEVAEMLSKWKLAKEVRMNCVFPTATGSPKNEIDMIINTGTKLLFVECKTQIKNETDVDKFASAVKVYGGLGSKALFVTDAPMNDKALEKCADHGIMAFSMQNNIFGLSPDKMLFAMLESELFNINAK